MTTFWRLLSSLSDIIAQDSSDSEEFAELIHCKQAIFDLDCCSFVKVESRIVQALDLSSLRVEGEDHFWEPCVSE